MDYYGASSDKRRVPPVFYNGASENRNVATVQVGGGVATAFSDVPVYGPEPALRMDTAVYDPYHNSRLNPDRYPSYTDDKRLTASPREDSYEDQRGPTCSPRCMCIAAALLFVATVITVIVVAVVLTSRLSPTDADPTEPPPDPPLNGSELALVTGEFLLYDWLYHPDLEDPNSALFLGYEATFCESILEETDTAGLGTPVCTITDISPGSCRITFVLGFNQDQPMDNVPGLVQIAINTLVTRTSYRGTTTNSRPAQRDDCHFNARDDSPCDQRCSRDGDSVQCMCYDGYKLDDDDDDKCKDIDECDDEDLCDHDCENLEGSYQCSCQDGYLLQPDSHTCIDIDECEDSYVCDQLCDNTDGSYVCGCSPGFELTGDGKTCADIDECDDRPCFNEAECVDRVNSVECNCLDGFLGRYCEYELEAECNVTLTQCKDGFMEQADGSCLDIDECDQSPCVELCSNTVGSYECSCEPGRVMYEDTTCYDFSVEVVDAVEIARNTSVVIICHVYTDEMLRPEVQISWLDEDSNNVGNDITSEVYAIEVTLGDHSASFLNITQASDPGVHEYTCVATYNRDQQIMAATNLSVAECYPWELKCDDKCVPPSKICDGKLHCKLAEDEADCDCNKIFPGKLGVKCNFGLCIPKAKWCNGIIDCHDRSDEPPGCAGECPPGYRECATDSQCIPESLWCDFIPDCTDASDEGADCSCPPPAGVTWPGSIPERNMTTPMYTNPTYPGGTPTSTPWYTTLPYTDTTYPYWFTTAYPYPDASYTYRAAQKTSSIPDPKQATSRPTTVPPYTTPTTRTTLPPYTSPTTRTMPPHPTQPTRTTLPPYTSPTTRTQPPYTTPSTRTQGPNTTAVPGPPALVRSRPRVNYDQAWMRCDSGQCLPSAFFCDGNVNCADGSDESDQMCFGKVGSLI